MHSCTWSDTPVRSSHAQLYMWCRSCLRPHMHSRTCSDVTECTAVHRVASAPSPHAQPYMRCRSYPVRTCTAVHAVTLLPRPHMHSCTRSDVPTPSTHAQLCTRGRHGMHSCTRTDVMGYTAVHAVTAFSCPSVHSCASDGHEQRPSMHSCASNGHDTPMAGLPVTTPCTVPSPNVPACTVPDPVGIILDPE